MEGVGDRRGDDTGRFGDTGRVGDARDVPGAGLRIRPATVADAGLILRLTLAAYEEYRATLVPPSTVFDETEDDIRRHLAGDGHGSGGQIRGGAESSGERAARPRSGALIAEIDETPVGCVRWSVNDEAPGTVNDGAPAVGAPWLYVGRLSVPPAFRANGIGTALVRACEDLARRRGIAEVRLGVRLTLERNEALYERLGYRRTGETFERAGFGAIAVWMSRRIEPADRRCP